MSNPLADTICARATPPGTGAIAMVRLSGPQAIDLAARCFRPHSAAQDLAHARSHSLIFGHLFDPDSLAPVDDVLVSIMRGPHSYTGEDVVEINLHGSPAIVRRTLRLFVDLGVRLADPGEFTRRAFEHGQIDLAQAEAICDLITAQSQAAAAIALRQLEGQLSERLGTVRERLVDLLAQIEARLDFPEEDLPEETDRWLLTIHSAGEEIERLVAGGERGQLLREGARVVLVGKPNAGKSSLFNRLLGQERAIVSEEPGTTRDSLESLVEVAGLPLTVIDTAGLRAAAGTIERLGMARTEREVKQAAVIVVCVPGDEPWTERDEAVWHLACDSKPLMALTKGDLPAVLTAEALHGRTGHEVIATSAVTGEGIESLVAALGRRILEGGDEDAGAGDPLVASERHLQALRLALNSLSAAVRGLGTSPALELVAADLREAVAALDQILGLELGDEVLDRIFSRFCIGK